MAAEIPRTPSLSSSEDKLADTEKLTQNDLTPHVLTKKEAKLVKALLHDKDVDESFRVLRDNPDIPPPTPEEARRIRNKAVAVLLPFASMIYLLMYLDKNSLSNTSILGLLPALGIGQNDFNSAVSALYVGYLVAELPQGYALQRFPAGTWLMSMLSGWAALLFLHCTVTSFSGLYGIRFCLGLLESCAVPALLLTLNKFLTFDEQAMVQVIFWGVGNASPIPAGLLAYASLHANVDFPTYKIFFIIIASLTGATAILGFFLFPNSSHTAWFFTPRERVQSIYRLRGNKAGQENHVYKRHQLIEAFTDWKTWAFALHALLQELGNGFSSQYTLIIKSFGYSTLETTLYGCITGATALGSLWIAAIMLYFWPKNSRAYISAINYVPVILSGILGAALPWSNKQGLLAAIYLRATTGVPYALAMSWASATTCGYTKKAATIALYHVAYGLANVISPYLFQARDAPRFIPAFISLSIVSALLPALLLLVIRYLLNKENKRRDALQAADTGVVEEFDDKGQAIQIEANVSQLDQTDRENLAFRYVL